MFTAGLYQSFYFDLLTFCAGIFITLQESIAFVISFIFQLTYEIEEKSDFS